MAHLSADRLGQLHILQDDFSDAPFILSLPEFQGQTEGRGFAVRQVLDWTVPGEKSDAECSLDGDPSLIGLQIYGQIKSGADRDLHMLFQLANAQAQSIEKAHSTLLLDTSNNPDFQDPDGSRTFFFTDMHWLSAQDLHQRSQRGSAPYRVGLNYGGATLMWKMAVRKSVQGDRMIAVGTDRAYVFASDHPKWNPGLLAGVRWGNFHPGEFKESRIAIYMLQSDNLEDLHPYYMRDLKK